MQHTSYKRTQKRDTGQGYNSHQRFDPPWRSRHPRLTRQIHKRKRKRHPHPHPHTQQPRNERFLSAARKRLQRSLGLITSQGESSPTRRIHPVPEVPWLSPTRVRTGRGDIGAGPPLPSPWRYAAPPPFLTTPPGSILPNTARRRDSSRVRGAKDGDIGTS